MKQKGKGKKKRPPRSPLSSSTVKNGLSFKLDLIDNNKALLSWSVVGFAGTNKIILVQRSNEHQFNTFQTIARFTRDETSFEDIDLLPATTYLYRIVADLGPVVITSDPLSVKTKEQITEPNPFDPPASPPTKLQFEGLLDNGPRVKLSWNGQTPKNGYFEVHTALSDPSNRIDIISVMEGTFEVTSNVLIPGKTYYFTVSNCSGDGQVCLFSKETVRVDVPRQPGWHHSVNSMDVNLDGFVSPVDAEIIIDNLDSFAPHGILPNYSDFEHFCLDVNNDGRLTPVDAIIIINYMSSAY